VRWTSNIWSNCVEVVMGGLRSALDALAADDLDAVSDGALLDRTALLVAARNRIDAELARTVRKAELRQACEYDGLTTMPSWLRTHTRLSGGAAKDIVTAGRALERLPAVAAACAAGHVTAGQVEVIARIVTPDALTKAADQGLDLAEIEQVLVDVAVTQPYRQLQKTVGHYLEHLDPDGPEPDPTEGRSFSMVQHPDGTFTGGFTLDHVGGEKLATALESITAASRCAGDTRTRPQRLGDALVQLTDLALASGRLPILRTVKPHVGVLVGIDDLVSPGTGPGSATTGLGAAISAARARWIACDSTVGRIVIGPDSVPLDTGRTHRVVPPHLRRAIELRDKTCVFAGCEAPHQGPPRLPHRTTTRRPMAHLSPRRHRDPDPEATANLRTGRAALRALLPRSRIPRPAGPSGDVIPDRPEDDTGGRVGGDDGEEPVLARAAHTRRRRPAAVASTAASSRTTANATCGRVRPAVSESARQMLQAPPSRKPPTSSRTSANVTGYSAPLVEGTSATRGSIATAVRSARASALNWPSTMWWASRPA
jgi:hypothetical protein